jgi:G:T/U-mismatch repair DNA glycosylase/cytochrome c556
MRKLPRRWVSFSGRAVSTKLELPFDEDSVMLLFRNVQRAGQSSFRKKVSQVRIIRFTILFAAVSQIAFAQNKIKDSVNVRVDDKGRKFVNKIPFDVFFDDPLGVVKNNNSVASPAEAMTQKEDRPTPTTSPTAPSPKGGSIPWQELIPIEELQGEVKTVRNSLNKQMANQGSYNSNFKEIAVDGAEMAALAGIVQEHAESLSWKDKAKYVRDFGAQLSQSAIGLGKDNFEKTRSAFQKLTSVLEGSIPVDAGDVPSTRPFNEAASRKGLMKRIEKAKNFLKQDVNSEAKFKSLSDQIRREAALISALGSVITTSGYEYTSDDDYQNHAKTLIDGGKEAASALHDESYDRFKQAVDKVNKSCTDCHASYGNG